MDIEISYEDQFQFFKWIIIIDAIYYFLKYLYI